MNASAKLIFGSVARHWLGAFLGVIGVRIGLHPDAASAATTALTDDAVSNCIIATLAALGPLAASIWHALRERLRLKIALLLHHGASEAEVDNLIANTTRRSQAAGVLTSDPGRLAP